MNKQETATLLRVGIFMAIGLSVIAIMVVYFGRFGDAVRGYYDLRAEFPDASGIYKGAGVLLAGAKVGIVGNDPVILPNMDGVSVNLKIYDDVEIPSKSQFLIGSSGMLGDKFVQIALDSDAKGSPAIPRNAIVKGRTGAGLGELTTKADAMMGELQETVANIKSITAKLDSGVFTGTTMGDLTTTIANLKQTSASFADSAKKLDGVINKAEGAIGTGDEALKSAKSAADSAKSAADELKKTIADVRGIVQQTKQGKGALGALLVDREMADNLRTLVANLKRNGILWYKDKSAPPEAAR